MSHRSPQEYAAVAAFLRAQADRPAPSRIVMGDLTFTHLTVILEALEIAYRVVVTREASELTLQRAREAGADI